MSDCSIQMTLLSLPCHFTWKHLQEENVGRALQMNIDNLEEHIKDTIQGTELESYNLMGFYKTQQESFHEARVFFVKALEHTKTEDEKIVSLACLAWLTWKERMSDPSCKEEIIEEINQVKQVLHGRQGEDIPDVMAEKAFSIANSGFTEKGYKEALVCIDKALKKRPDNAMFKFTKAIVIQKLFQAKSTYAGRNDPEVKNIIKFWKETIECLEKYAKCPFPPYCQGLIHCALFLVEMNHDCASEYAKMAAKNAPVSHHAIWRNIAKFYIKTGGNDVRNLNKTEGILEGIVSEKPTEAVFKERLLLGQLLLKKYTLTKSDKTFDKAEKCLQTSWDENKKYLLPAFDLVRLYETKFDVTQNVCLLGKLKCVFREAFGCVEKSEKLINARVFMEYGLFLKEYGKDLASYYQRLCMDDESALVRKTDEIEKALKLLELYSQDRDEDKLLRVEQEFTAIYNNLEQMREPVKALLHQEYAAFLKTYSRDLAFCCFVKSVEYNPLQRWKYSYKNLEELAQEKINATDEEEQFRGHKTYGWLHEQKYHTFGEQKDLKIAMNAYEQAKQLKPDDEKVNTTFWRTVDYM